MKVLLAIGILSICACSVMGSPLVRQKRDENEKKEIPEEKKDEVTKMMNDGRKKLAELLQISNMHKLSWDDDLDVQDLGCEKDFDKWIDEKMEEFKKKATVERFIEVLDSMADDTILGCFNPERTQFNCKRKDCNGTPTANCACGPKNGFKKSDVKKGKPGEDCEGDSDDGLCEEDGASGLFAVGTILNLIVFYLISSFIF